MRPGWTLTTLLLLALPAPAAPLPLHLAANYWEPYTGKDLPQQGVASDIVSTALRRAGYAVDITIMPWSRVLTSAYQHQNDGVVAIWSTSERRGKLLFSDSYMSNQLFILHMPCRLQDASTLAQLSGARIGIGRDYEYSDEFLSQKNVQLEPVDRTIQNLLKLTIGRIDGVLEDKLIAQYHIQSNIAAHDALGDIEFAPAPLMTLPLYLAINPQTAHARQIIEQFNLELGKMRKDGTLDTIIARFQQQLAPKTPPSPRQRRDCAQEHAAPAPNKP
ncbi:ABC transporter substrate-binding protein [Rugamonas sp.]|uniref:substrate-binding periplasmic protein n=1 Tax=Rugamonas sp. TaxID=1926287 RepID=UPI0025D9BBA4|nr:transporter substrate-binding domain-containing protein [Rugamonas sp.]